MRYSACASARWISTRPRSNSYMPIWNTPATVKRRKRGSTPAGVTLAWGIIRSTLSPTSTPRLVASSRPRMMRNSPAFRSLNAPTFMCWAISETLASSSGRMPRSSVPERSLPCFTMPSPSM